MFYAAFEIRCGIEKRLKEYAQTWEHVSKATKNGWQIAKLAAGLEQAFYGLKKVVVFRVELEPEIFDTLIYTPVTKSLQKRGETLGRYLHAQSGVSKMTDEWWSEFAAELAEAYRELAFATRGTLLGPPLMKAGTRELKLQMEIIPDRQLNMSAGLIGRSLEVKVEYCDVADFAFPKGAYIWEVPSIRAAG